MSDGRIDLVSDQPANGRCFRVLNIVDDVTVLDIDPERADTISRGEFTVSDLEIELFLRDRDL